MLNRVILMGRLCAAPELKTTVSGVSVTSFRIAVERSYKKEGEERKADFIDVVCWRKTAEFVCRYFGKGSLIALEGELQTRSYEVKDGTLIWGMCDINSGWRSAKRLFELLY